MSKHILFGIALAVLLLSGCASNPDVQLVELSKNTVVYEEIVRINNCGGKGDSEQIASRDFATTVEFGAGVSAGYQSIVQGNLFAKYSEYRNTSKSQRLVAPPGTNMEFVLRWSDDVRAGNVQVNGKSGTYEVRIPVSVEQVASRDLGCGLSLPVQPTIPTGQSTSSSSTHSLTREERLQNFLNDLNSRYPDVGFYVIKYNQSEKSFWIGIGKAGSDLPAVTLPSANVAGDFEFHYWDGKNGGDIAHPAETIDPYGSDSQTGLIGTLFLLP